MKYTILLIAMLFIGCKAKEINHKKEVIVRDRTDEYNSKYPNGVYDTAGVINVGTYTVVANFKPDTVFIHDTVYVKVK